MPYFKPANLFDVQIYDASLAYAKGSTLSPESSKLQTAKDIVELRKLPGIVVAVDVRTDPPPVITSGAKTEIVLGSLEAPTERLWTSLVTTPDEVDTNKPFVIYSSCVGALVASIQEELENYEHIQETSQKSFHTPHQIRQFIEYYQICLRVASSLQRDFKALNLESEAAWPKES